MAKDLTNHQRKIVDRYYQHIDTIMANKISELVSELYLAETEKKREALWGRVEKALGKTATTDAEMRKLLADRDLERLARLATELSGPRGRK